MITARLKLHVFDDRYYSSETAYPKKPQIELKALYSVTLYAPGTNTAAVEVSYTFESARAAKGLTLNPGGTSDISVSTQNEEFDLNAWVRNASGTVTQQVYVFGLRYRED